MALLLDHPRVLRPARVGAFGAALALLLAACGGGEQGVAGSVATRAPAVAPATAGATTPVANPSPVAQAYTVAMNDLNRYAPAALTVPKGATMTWQNLGSMPHTVTDDPSKALNKADAVLPVGAQPWD